MMLGYRYRIYPSKAQETKLEHTLSLCCELYNAALQERRDAYRMAGKSIRYLDQQNQLPEIKELRPELNGIHSQVLQDVLRRLDKAFDAFFRRVKNGEKPGFPRFRRQSGYDSFTYAQSGFALKDGKLRLSKIGRVKIKLHRPTPGEIKTLTITRTATGKWFACFSVEVEPDPLPMTTKAIGIDCGLEKFATFSDGTEIANPRFFRANERALQKAQAKKKRRAASRIHERIAHRRWNFAHQLSHFLVATFGLIVFENLNIKGMVRNHYLSKSIQDAAWNQLIQFTAYKAENAGRKVLTVAPRNTSQRCSQCGKMVAKSLAERIHRCICGLCLDRDHNAAINILTLGLQSQGQSLREAPSF